MAVAARLQAEALQRQRDFPISVHRLIVVAHRPVSLLAPADDVLCDGK
jgi:hypothetical protein